jgi:hypothetical protein
MHLSVTMGTVLAEPVHGCYKVRMLCVVEYSRRETAV